MVTKTMVKNQGSPVTAQSIEEYVHRLVKGNPGPNMEQAGEATIKKHIWVLSKYQNDPTFTQKSVEGMAYDYIFPYRDALDDISAALTGKITV